MRKQEVKAALQIIPSAALVEFFMDQANLTKQERSVIILSLKEEKTYEEIEEILFISSKTAARRYKSGFAKLSAYLDGMRWLIDGLLN